MRDDDDDDDDGDDDRHGNGLRRLVGEEEMVDEAEEEVVVGDAKGACRVEGAMRGNEDDDDEVDISRVVQVGRVGRWVGIDVCGLSCNCAR